MAKPIDRTTPEWDKIFPKTFVSEQAFVNAMKSGVQLAWDEFQDLYDREIRFFVYRFHGLPADSLEDQVQDVYLRMQRAIQNFRHQCPLHYFVRKVTLDLCTDTIRKTIRRDARYCSMNGINIESIVHNYLSMASEGTDVIEAVIRNERASALREVLATLTERCQEVIRRRYFEHEKYKKIAEELTLATNTIGSRLRKCMEKMVSELVAYQ
jgi:RNA polymerase sigma factor (sigma-70 family)